jgi:DNA adenine methylase
MAPIGCQLLRWVVSRRCEFSSVTPTGYDAVMPAGSSRDVLREWHDRVGHARPFLRWAGGKQLFLQRYSALLPSFSGRYIEGFLGSGAVFFYIMRTHLRPPVSYLGDTNRHLIRCFIEVRDDPVGVHERLQVLSAGYEAAMEKGDFYYQVRESHNSRHPRSDAATFIFLNRAGWNGLYRVNKKGLFNVPFGPPKRGLRLPDQDDLLGASAALARSQLRATRWENTLALAEPGDFVYLDPPYFSELMKEDRAQEGKYHKRPFTLRDHESLARACANLAARDVHFLLTNSAEPEMVNLYGGYGLSVTEIEMPRSINSKGDQRAGAARELIAGPPGDGIKLMEAQMASSLVTDESVRLDDSANDSPDD